MLARHRIPRVGGRMVRASSYRTRPSFSSAAAKGLDHSQSPRMPGGTSMDVRWSHERQERSMLMTNKTTLKLFAGTGLVAILQLAGASTYAGTNDASSSGSGSANAARPAVERPFNGYSDSAPMYSPRQPWPGIEPSASPNSIARATASDTYGAPLASGTGSASDDRPMRHRRLIPYNGYSDSAPM